MSQEAPQVPQAVAGVPLATPGEAIDLRREYDGFFIRCTTVSLLMDLLSSGSIFLVIGTVVSIGLKLTSTAILSRASVHTARIEEASGRNVTSWTELEVCAHMHWSTIVVQLLLLMTVVVCANEELAQALLGGLGPPIGRRVVGVVAPPGGAADAERQWLHDGGTVRIGPSAPAAPAAPEAVPSPPQRPPRAHEDHGTHISFLLSWASCPRLTHAKRTLALAMTMFCTLYCTAIVSGPTDPDMGPAGCTLSTAAAGLASGSVLNAHRRQLVKVSSDTVLLFLSTVVHSMLYHTFLCLVVLLHVLLLANSAPTVSRLYIRLLLCASVVYGLGVLYDLIVPMVAHFQLAVASTWDAVLPCTLGRPRHLLLRVVPTHDLPNLIRGWPSAQPSGGGAKALHLERLPRVSAALPEQASDTLRILASTLFGLRLLSGLLVTFGFAVGMQTF